MHIFWVEIYWGRYGINFKWAKNHLWCLASSMETVQQITFLLPFAYLCLPPGCQLILGQKSCKHIVFTPQTCCYSACRQDIPVLFMDFYRCRLTSCSTSSPRRSSVGPDLSDKQQTAICNNLWKLCSQSGLSRVECFRSGLVRVFFCRSSDCRNCCCGSVITQPLQTFNKSEKCTHKSKSMGK